MDSFNKNIYSFVKFVGNKKAYNDQAGGKKIPFALEQ